MITKSAFSFYYNTREREKVSGYGVEGSVAGNEDHSGVLRFKEKRIIQPERVAPYQILSGGFVFSNRRCFYLVGAAFETDCGIDEERMGAADIRHVHSVWYVLDDDDNADLLRGLKITALRRQGDPAAAVIELEKIPALTFKDWTEIEQKSEIVIGTVEASKDHVSAGKLKPNIDESFNMVRVNAYK